MTPAVSYAQLRGVKRWDRCEDVLYTHPSSPNTETEKTALPQARSDHTRRSALQKSPEVPSRARCCPAPRSAPPGQGAAPPAPPCPAYLRGTRARARGSTCCRTGRCPPAPCRARTAAGAEPAAPDEPCSWRAGRLTAPNGPLTVTHQPRCRSPPLQPACQQRRSPLVGAGQPRAQDGGGAVGVAEGAPCWGSCRAARPGWTSRCGCAAPRPPAGSGARGGRRGARRCPRGWRRGPRLPGAGAGGGAVSGRRGSEGLLRLSR